MSAPHEKPRGAALWAALTSAWLLGLSSPAGAATQLVNAVQGQTIPGAFTAPGALMILPELPYRVTNAKVSGPLSVTYEGNQGIVVRASSRGQPGSAQFTLLLGGGRTVTVQVQQQAGKGGGETSYLVLR